MPSGRSHFVIAVLSLPLWLFAASCGAKGPAVGTPGFYWNAARETFATRDYLKTTEHLRRVIRTENEFTQQALPFRLVVSSGVAQTYLDLASDCQKGVKASPQTALPMRRAMSSYWVTAETRALEFAETFIQFRKEYKGQTVSLEFPFPAADVADIVERGSIQGGTLLSAERMAYLEQKMRERMIAEAAAAAVGAPGDMPKARLAFQAGRAEVSREVFMAAMLKSLYNQTGLFGREAMNKPDRVVLLVEQGTEALKTMEKNEQNERLATDFQMLLKMATQPRP